MLVVLKPSVKYSDVRRALNLKLEEVNVLSNLVGKKIDNDINYEGAYFPLNSEKEYEIICKVFASPHKIDDEDLNYIERFLSKMDKDEESYIAPYSKVSVEIAEMLVRNGYVVMDLRTREFIGSIIFKNDTTDTAVSQKVAVIDPKALIDEERGLMSIRQPRTIDKLEEEHPYIYTGLTVNFLERLLEKRPKCARVKIR